MFPLIHTGRCLEIGDWERSFYRNLFKSNSGSGACHFQSVGISCGTPYSLHYAVGFEGRCNKIGAWFWENGCGHGIAFEILKPSHVAIWSLSRKVGTFDKHCLTSIFRSHQYSEIDFLIDKGICFEISSVVLKIHIGVGSIIVFFSLKSALMSKNDIVFRVFWLRFDIYDGALGEVIPGGRSSDALRRGVERCQKEVAVAHAVPSPIEMIVSVGVSVNDESMRGRIIKACVDNCSPFFQFIIHHGVPFMRSIIVSCYEWHSLVISEEMNESIGGILEICAGCIFSVHHSASVAHSGHKRCDRFGLSLGVGVGITVKHVCPVEFRIWEIELGLSAYSVSCIGVCVYPFSFGRPIMCL